MPMFSPGVAHAVTLHAIREAMGTTRLWGMGDKGGMGSGYDCGVSWVPVGTAVGTSRKGGGHISVVVWSTEGLSGEGSECVWKRPFQGTGWQERKEKVQVGRTARGSGESSRHAAGGPDALGWPVRH